jgi:hypothetical protein
VRVEGETVPRPYGIKNPRRGGFETRPINAEATETLCQLNARPLSLITAPQRASSLCTNAVSSSGVLVEMLMPARSS